MNDLDLHGKFSISHVSIRRISIICHALDSSVESLYKNSFLSGEIKNSYSEIFCEELLYLAILVRANIYQGNEKFKEKRKNSDIGWLYKSKKDDAILENGSEEHRFSIKDVCDKIIHANDICRSLVKNENQPLTLLSGTDNNKNQWELLINVSNLCLEIIDIIDKS